MQGARSGLLAAGAAPALVGIGMTPAFAAQSPTLTDCASRPSSTPCVVLTGTSDAATAAADTPVRFTFDAVNDGGGSASYHLAIDSTFVVDPSTVEVDGKKAPTDDHLRLTDPVILAAGVHHSITFTAPADYNRASPSVTTLHADRGVVSNDVTTSPPAVDVRSVDDPMKAITYGNPRTGIEIDPIGENVGTEAVRLRITFPLPAGWTARPRPETPSFTCAETGGVETCDDSQSLKSGRAVNVPLNLYPPVSAPAGTKLEVHVHLEPIGRTDERPDDNDTTFTVVDDGIADLSATVTTSADTVAVGQTIRARVTVTNAGPAPTADLFVFVSPDGQYLKRKVVLSHARGPGRIDPDTSSLERSDVLGWQPGVLAPGQTVVLTLTVTGRTVGDAHLDVTTEETAGDPGAASVADGRFETTRAQSPVIHVVAHEAASAGGSTVSGSPIAATGVAGIGAGLGWGALLVVLGAGLTVLGRTRYAARHAGR